MLWVLMKISNIIRTYLEQRKLLSVMFSITILVKQMSNIFLNDVLKESSNDRLISIRRNKAE